MLDSVVSEVPCLYSGGALRKSLCLQPAFTKQRSILSHQGSVQDTLSLLEARPGVTWQVAHCSLILKPPEILVSPICHPHGQEDQNESWDLASWAAAASAHSLQPCLSFFSRFLDEVRQGGPRNEVMQMWPVEHFSKERGTSCPTIWLAGVSQLFFGDAAASFIAVFGAELKRFLSQISLI